MNPNYLLINSKSRENYYNSNSSNFRIYFDKNINIKEYIKLKYLSLARTNYLITEKNNKFSVIFETGKKLTINIPYGIYSPLQLIASINIFFNDEYGFVSVYDNYLFKITFYANIEFQIDFSISEFHKLINVENKIINSISKSIRKN